MTTEGDDLNQVFQERCHSLFAFVALAEDAALRPCVGDCAPLFHFCVDANHSSSRLKDPRWTDMAFGHRIVRCEDMGDNGVCLRCEAFDIASTHSEGRQSRRVKERLDQITEVDQRRGITNATELTEEQLAQVPKMRGTVMCHADELDVKSLFRGVKLLRNGDGVPVTYFPGRVVDGVSDTLVRLAGRVLHRAIFECDEQEGEELNQDPRHSALTEIFMWVVWYSIYQDRDIFAGVRMRHSSLSAVGIDAHFGRSHLSRPLLQFGLVYGIADALGPVRPSPPQREGRIEQSEHACLQSPTWGVGSAAWQSL